MVVSTVVFVLTVLFTIPPSTTVDSYSIVFEKARDCSLAKSMVRNSAAATKYDVKSYKCVKKEVR